ncbi:MAG: hypothetical protein AMJ66_07090 [Betaproteobacteria bacterium SG8_40]|nr:MAG: hypothetical protein AMJ66_07090 [Betaproteobacteria bacterium SG8_40]
MLTVYLGLMIYAAATMAGLRRYAWVLGSALVLQVGLGISNVLAMLPLALAVAHNAGAALLLMMVVVLNFVLRQETAG